MVFNILKKKMEIKKIFNFKSTDILKFNIFSYGQPIVSRNKEIYGYDFNPRG